MIIKQVDIGMSTASVYQCISETDTYFLKINSKNSWLKDEYRNILWLYNKAPIPKIVEWYSDDINDYLLMSKINGLMLCDEYYLSNPVSAIYVLAKGLQLLQSIDIKNCNIVNNLDKKLNSAKNYVKNSKVDINYWDEETKKSFKSPNILLEYLYDNRPENEELVFTHGDYCLPNIFGIGNELSGFIDLSTAGIADKWQDIALCIRSFRYNFNTTEYDNLLLNKLGIEKDDKKLKYYILLDELF
jgi:kanamycin kinase/aminoglycoside 3'-phosphotransferase-3